MDDGSEASLDLSKGMYDAGDHMKFGFPMAYTATVLSWTILEYGDQMKAVDQLDTVRGSLKWITDFLINAHPTDNVLYVQVKFDPFLFTELEGVCIVQFMFFCCQFNVTVMLIDLDSVLRKLGQIRHLLSVINFSYDFGFLRKLVKIIY